LPHRVLRLTRFLYGGKKEDLNLASQCRNRFTKILVHINIFNTLKYVELLNFDAEEYVPNVTYLGKVIVKMDKE